MKAIVLPSGAQRGVLSDDGPVMSALLSDIPSPPVVGATQMSAFRRPAGISVVVRTNATVRPSGESCGSVTRTATSRSWIVIARRACAASVTATHTQRQPTTATRARMGPRSAYYLLIERPGDQVVHERLRDLL